MAKTYDAFDEWLSKQDEPTKSLISERFASLENTVKATRQERDILNDQLKELGSKLEKGSDAEKQVNELRNNLLLAERKTKFLENAPLQGCLRPSAAYVFAQSQELFTDDGKVDWKALRESVPELFRPADRKGNAGSGTDTIKSITPTDANTAIRAAAHKSN